MALYEVFSHSDRFHYRAKLISLATCFFLLCTILTFLSPILFAYYADGFWIKESVYSEQARVNFSSKYIFIAETNDRTTNRFFSSSYATLNTAFRNSLIPVSCIATPTARNSDRITDQFQINCTTQFSNNSTSLILNSVDFWLIFEYELRARQSIVMETMGLISFYPPNGASLSNNLQVSTAGKLVLQQRQPIQSSGSDTTYNKSIINTNTLLTTSSLDLNSILNDYFTRKYYTTYQPIYTQWTPGLLTTTNNQLTIIVTVQIDNQSIRFIPGFWQEFKWGWIQYLCVLLPFIIIFNYIKEFTFRNQIVRTLVEFPYHRHKN